MTAAAAEAGFGKRGGTVVNVTVSPHRGYPGLAHTGAARAAIEQTTREQADSWSERGIAVIAAAIGRFDTESLRKYPENVWRAAASSVPLQRLGTLDEFAWLITLLASPLGRELSGSVVTLDGALDNWDGPWPRDVMLDEEGNVPTEERAGGS
jgi:citronellol/citronellal dehydrogenase